MLGLLLVASSLVVIQFKSPENSTIVDLKVRPDEGWVANETAPWKLEVSNEQNVKTKTQDLKLDLPGYVLDVEGHGGQLSYRMTAFLCTKDKTECKREVFNGTVQIP